ncbi:MAG: tRNA pseudouridine(38-40) synthase TruA [Pseudomonadota bacterium]
MPRYRLDVEFDGTPYVGWQRQDNGPSVQGALEQAGLQLTQSTASCVGAGRTDAGVHALCMTAHIDLAKAMPEDTVRDGLNAHLRPQPVSVLRAARASDDWHARFTCHRRHYLYRILSRRSPPALTSRKVWHVLGPLDVSAMTEAARHLTGKHDFTTFRSVHCQSASPVKTLSSVEVEQQGEEVHFRLHAPSFLHNQVRSIVGTLAQVGLGRWSPEDVKTALIAADRSQCGPVAPASGLYFAKADYPETDEFT